jgi:hypothetical protein
MTGPRRALVIIVGGVMSVPAVALLTALCLRHMEAAELAAGGRVSTGGDSPGIPIIGVTVAWTGLLCLVGAVYTAVKFIKWALRSDPR